MMEATKPTDVNLRAMLNSPARLPATPTIPEWNTAQPQVLFFTPIFKRYYYQLFTGKQISIKHDCFHTRRHQWSSHKCHASVSRVNVCPYWKWWLIVVSGTVWRLSIWAANLTCAQSISAPATLSTTQPVLMVLSCEFGIPGRRRSFSSRAKWCARELATSRTHFWRRRSLRESSKS